MTPTPKPRLFNQPAPDDRSIAQQLADLGVTVERSERAKQNTITRIASYKPCYGPKPRRRTVKLNKSGLYFSADFRTACGGVERVMIDVGEYRGQRVLLIKPGDEGLKMSTTGPHNQPRGGLVITSRRLAAWLIEQGITLGGMYEIVKLKSGGFMGVPMEETK